MLAVTENHHCRRTKTQGSDKSLRLLELRSRALQSLIGLGHWVMDAVGTDPADDER